MEREQYIKQIEEGLIAMRFEEVPPNDLFGFETERTFLGFTLTENEEVKNLLSNFVAYSRFEERPSPQDDILEYVAIDIPEFNTPEVREDPETSPIAAIRNVSSWIKGHIGSLEIDSGVKIFIHLLFVTEDGTKNIKKAIKHNAVAEYPDYGILPVLADVGNETLTYNTEYLGGKGLVGTPYIEQLNERAEEYFSVSE